VQRKFRLTRLQDFIRVRQSGKSYAHPLIVLITWTNDEMKIRVGVAAGRAVGTAAKRNRAKRLLREAMRPLFSYLTNGWDLILIARPALASSTLPDTRQALVDILQRAKLISNPDAI
jgi:ribonuclease P protein component